MILDTLTYNESIKTLDISRSQGDSSCLDSIVKFISENQSIEELRMNGYKWVNDDALKSILHSVIGNSSLRVLEMQFGTVVTDASLPLIEEAIQSSNLVSLKLEGSLIHPPGFERIRTWLKTPLDTRAIPIKSNTKSAAKSFR